MVEFYSLSQVGQDDGASEVTLTVTCGKCGQTYGDKESVDIVRKWLASGYAPCPNIYCTGEMINSTLKIEEEPAS